MPVPTWYWVVSIAGCNYTPGTHPGRSLQELLPKSRLKEQINMLRPAYPSQRLPQPQLEAGEDAQVHDGCLRSLQAMRKAIINAACTALCSGHLLCPPTVLYQVTRLCHYRSTGFARNSCSIPAVSKFYSKPHVSSMTATKVQDDIRCCKDEVFAPESQRLLLAACTSQWPALQCPTRCPMASQRTQPSLCPRQEFCSMQAAV